MKILLIGLLFSTLSYAEHKKGTNCYNLRRTADNSCNSFDVQCSNLGACIHKRNTCPGDVKHKAGCEAFSDCLSDTKGLKSTKPKNIANIKFESACVYRWTSYDTCRLHNTKIEFINYPTCPGRKSKINGDKRSYDREFNCEGHRKILKHENSECSKNSMVYDNACSSVAGYKKVPRFADKCEFENKKVFPPDTKHKGAKSMDDGERDRFKSMPHDDEGAGGNGSKGGAGK